MVKTKSKQKGWVVLHVNMHIIEHTYISLLADVAIASGFSEIRGSYVDLQWCLNEAPKLEKHILGCIETGCEPDLDMFPNGLKRLAAASVKDAVQLRYLRQLLLFCYKASVPHDTKTTEKAFHAFIDCNSTVGKFGADLARVCPVLLDSARRHVQSVLYRFKGGTSVPSHGPGAVTTSKRKWQHRYDTIEAIYPFSDWFSLQNRSNQEEYEDAVDGGHIEAKLIAVPKDTRGPRLICVHPAEAIWIQQSVRRCLENAISSPRLSKGPWPHGHIFFKKQAVNGRISLLSSRSRRYATIDMKEASDRISETLVQMLFGSKYKYFGACRAQKFRVPQLGSARNLVGDIYSYAPMGNATTFPVQSLVFWAICVASLQRQGFHQPGAVFVFGDDIIVPTVCAEAVINDLESFGLLVNRTKSFYRGAFRESCGVDAFNGVDVTPVRWKTTINAEHHVGLQSLSQLAMRLRIAGYEEAACTAFHHLRCLLGSNYGRQLFTTNNEFHGGIAEYTTNEYYVWRDAYWHKRHQWYHSPVWRVEDLAGLPEDHGWNHVLNSVCSISLKGDMEYTTRSNSQLESPPRATRLNRGWISVD